MSNPLDRPAAAKARQSSTASAPSETRLWIVRKGERHAELWARVHTEGLELRCFLDDSLLWKELYPLGSTRELRTVLDKHRAEWVTKGWAVTE